MNETTDPAGSTDVTLADAAERLDVHYMTAYRYVRTGRMAASKRKGMWWVSVDEITQYSNRELGVAAAVMNLASTSLSSSPTVLSQAILPGAGTSSPTRWPREPNPKRSMTEFCGLG